MSILIPVFIGVFAGVVAFLIQKNKTKEELRPFESKYKQLLQNGDTDYYAPVVWSPYYSFEHNKIGEDMAEKAMKQRVLDMPQLTFDRWLTFYNNKPDAWVIQKDESRKFANIPYYQKTTQHEDKRGKMRDFTTFVPVFWESAEEMKKYRDWVEEQYQHGKAAIYDQERAKNMKILAEQVQADLDEKVARHEAELKKMREEIQKPKEQEVKEPMKLRLSDGTEVAVDPTYQGMPITKYNGQATAQYAQYCMNRGIIQRPASGMVLMYMGDPVECTEDGDIAYNIIDDKIYVKVKGELVEIQ